MGDHKHRNIERRMTSKPSQCCIGLPDNIREALLDKALCCFSKSPAEVFVDYHNFWCRISGLDCLKIDKASLSGCCQLPPSKNVKNEDQTKTK